MYDLIFFISDIYKKASEKEMFSFDKFKSLPHAQALNYAKNSLPDVSGQGSARIVFKLGDKALKIAKNKKGLSQNKKEVEIHNKHGANELITKIYDSSPNGVWVLSELVAPLKFEKDFQKFTGIDIVTLKSYLFVEPEDFEELEEEFELMDIGKKEADFILNASKLFRDTNLIGGDFIRPDSWGVSSRGDVILLDYGMDSDLYKKMY